MAAERAIKRTVKKKKKGKRGGATQGSIKGKCGINPKSNRCKKGFPDPHNMCEMKSNGKCSKKSTSKVSAPQKTKSTDTEIMKLKGIIDTEKGISQSLIQELESRRKDCWTTLQAQNSEISALKSSITTHLSESKVFADWPRKGDSVEYLDKKSNTWKNAQIHKIDRVPDEPLRPSCVIKFPDGKFRDTDFSRLRRANPPKSRDDTLRESGPRAGTLSVGGLAVVHSLKSAPQHNGKRVRLIKADASGRWVVRAEDDQNQLSIKAQNLCPLSEKDLDKDTSPSKKVPTRTLRPSQFFNVGSSKSDITNILGPPQSLRTNEVYSHHTASGRPIYSQKEELSYNDYDVITLIDDKVHSYSNPSGKLPIGPPIKRKRGTIAIGTNKTEVLEILGYPMGYNQHAEKDYDREDPNKNLEKLHETLTYNDYDTITITDGRVHSYSNLSGKLPIRA